MIIFFNKVFSICIILLIINISFYFLKSFSIIFEIILNIIIPIEYIFDLNVFITFIFSNYNSNDI